MSYQMTFYFGLRSPYAWIARKILVGALSSSDRQDMEMVPYWSPAPATEEALRGAGGSFLYRPMSRQRHFYILKDVKRLADNCGLTVSWPVDRPGACWESAHLACLAATHEGRGEDAIDTLFSARWERGLDICDPATLRAILLESGLPDPTSFTVDSQRQLADEALAVQLRCFRAGVFGLPYFVSRREAYWGIDRLPAALLHAGLGDQRVVHACLRALGSDPSPDSPARLMKAVS